jgi:hypothetical protein
MLLLAALLCASWTIAASAQPTRADFARDKAIAHVMASYQEFAEPSPMEPSDPLAPLPSDRPRLGPSVLAEPSAAIGILAIGVVGWIGLGVSACVCRTKPEAD